jgi:hypothetical protein
MKQSESERSSRHGGAKSKPK